jgi:hypothetical protein
LLCTDKVFHFADLQKNDTQILAYGSCREHRRWLNPFPENNRVCNQRRTILHFRRYSSRLSNGYYMTTYSSTPAKAKLFHGQNTEMPSI